MLVLGLALGAGAPDRRPRIVAPGCSPERARRSSGSAAGAVVTVLAVAYLPSLTGTRLVDPALERDEDVPAAWTEAAAAARRRADGYRVLQVPGAEFGAFRWGYTVDPPLPGLTERPLVTRDLLPLGSPRRWTCSTRSTIGSRPAPSSLRLDRARRPAARRRHDLGRQRHRVRPLPDSPPGADPRSVRWRAPGLGDPAARRAGGKRPRHPDGRRGGGVGSSVGDPVPPVELVACRRAGPGHPRPGRRGAAVGQRRRHGRRRRGRADRRHRAHALLRDARPTPELIEATEPRRRLIITDTNRDRAHHWRSSQDVTGFTESGGPGPTSLRPDTGDERSARCSTLSTPRRRPSPNSGARAGDRDRLRRTVRLPAGAPAGDGDRRRSGRRRGSSATGAGAVGERILPRRANPIDGLTAPPAGRVPPTCAT